MRIDVSKRANVNAFMGAGGSGKSEQIKRELRRDKPKRLMIWDPEHEYADAASPHGAFGTVVRDLGTVHKMLTAAGAAGGFAIVFYPSDNSDAAKKQFDVFCRLASAAGNLTLVVEELAFVTMPSWAPEGWSMCTLRGRKRGLTIYGASQRPASVDKNFFANATRVRTGRLNYEADKKTLSNVLGVSMLEMGQLEPLQFIERNMANGEVSRGMLVFGAQQYAKKNSAKRTKKPATQTPPQ
jgi:hypothetical protein